MKLVGKADKRVAGMQRIMTYEGRSKTVGIIRRCLCIRKNEVIYKVRSMISYKELINSILNS